MVTLPDGAQIFFESDACPEGNVCVSADDPGSWFHPDLDNFEADLVVSPWALASSVEQIESGGLGLAAASSYLKGMSDGYIVDI